MKRRIYKLLRYGMLEKEQFDKVQSLIASENARTLMIASLVQFIYFGASFIGSMGVQEMADKRSVYAFGTIFPLSILLIHILLVKKHPAIVSKLVTCFAAGIFLTGLFCTLICTPDEMTILLLIFFFCIPMLFVITPLELLVLVLCTDIIYFVAAPIVKTAAVCSMDMIDMGIFSTLSVILGIEHMQGRFRRYWLETEAVDLAKVRYKAAFIDQLTGVFNRNAYNRDTEAMNTSILTDDFMYIALDLNGLKSANDTFGHIAGDELIVGAAECMNKSFSEYGTVYRVGGDEFVVILNAKDRGIGEILENFNKTMKEWKGTFVQKMTISYGIVVGDDAKRMTIHEIELLADKRMYKAKSEYYKNSGIDRRRR